MRRFIAVCFLLTCFWRCKKSDQTLSPFEVQVSGLSGHLSLLATDDTQHNAGVLNLINQDGNFTYSSAIVYPGDQLTIHYSSDYPVYPDSAAVATINYYYKGKKIGSYNGPLGYTTGFYSSLTIPSN